MEIPEEHFQSRHSIVSGMPRSLHLVLKKEAPGGISLLCNLHVSNHELDPHILCLIPANLRLRRVVRITGLRTLAFSAL